jgi:Predicted sugar kinase
MCITPLNSVQIATKPLVISSDLRLTFKLNPASRKHGFISADGQMKVEMGPDVEAELTGSDLYVPCKINFVFIQG